MHRCIPLFVLMLAATVASAASATALPRTLHPLAQRTTDEVIASDLAAIDGWRTTMQTLRQRNGGNDPWRTAAADGWLTAARTEYTDNDRTGFAEAAFGRAVSLIDELEAGKPAVTNTNAPDAGALAGSQWVRDDLYRELHRLKHHEGFDCAREEIARMEVEMAWTGNEQVDMGECNSSPHLAEAERLARLARDKEEACHVTAPPVAVKPAPVAPPKPAVPTREELRIPRNVHFALDKHFISPESHKVIEGIAALLAKYPSIRVRLEGHTDSRASVAYNLALSQRRVNAARAVFLALGIDSTRISTDYKGKGDLTAEEKDTRGFALNRRVEMVFVDPEGRDIQGEKQEGDLQLEGATPVVKRPAATPVRKPRATPVPAKPASPKPAGTPKP